MVLKYLKSLFRGDDADLPSYRIYRDLVGMARQTEFYADLGVADSLDGRFDMILVHLFVFVERLNAIGTPDAISLAQGIQERLVDDMDRSLREMGVGDMSIGKRVKQMGSAWLGRQTAYITALEADNPKAEFIEALSRNIYAGVGTDEHVETLANYVFAIRNALLKKNYEDFLLEEFKLASFAELVAEQK